EKLGKKRRTVCGDPGIDSFEGPGIDSFRIVRRLEQKRWYRADEHRLAYAVGSVLAQIAGHFAAAHGEADQPEIAEAPLRRELVQVFGDGVVVVARRRLGGLAEPSAVVGDDRVASCQTVQYLGFPGAAAQ